ncbi:MAG: hypothetical protein DRP66_09255 [Planctomycetota bacterium]|nr:MAG: hypothetical protein DRP66_09255 [Planctomycetota bacterium]
MLLLQIGGGAIAFVIIGRVLWETNQTQETVMYNAAFLVVFAFGILAGVALITRPGLGLVMSLIFQGIQIPLFASPVVSYKMFSGGFFNVYWRRNGWGADFAFLASRFDFYLNGGESLFLGVNILALVLFVLLIREMWWHVAELRDGRFKFADMPGRPAMAHDSPSAGNHEPWRGV